MPFSPEKSVPRSAIVHWLSIECCNSRSLSCPSYFIIYVTFIFQSSFFMKIIFEGSNLIYTTLWHGSYLDASVAQLVPFILATLPSWIDNCRPASSAPSGGRHPSSAVLVFLIERQFHTFKTQPLRGQQSTEVSILFPKVWLLKLSHNTTCNLDMNVIKLETRIFVRPGRS